MANQTYSADSINDGEWSFITTPFNTYGFSYAGMDPETYIPAPQGSPLNPSLLFPADQVMVQLNQYYFDADRNPLSGYLTFWPSSGFTISESGTSWYVPQRLCGTETWPGLDTGQSPWAWSMDTSGKIYIWLGLLTAILFATDNPNLSTDDGQQLCYRVTEHFPGGREYGIEVPGDTTGDLTSCIIPGTIRKHKFDALNPMGTLDRPLRLRRREPRHTWTVSGESTVYLMIDVGAFGLKGLSANPTGDPVYVAFMQTGLSPQMSDWHQAAWASDTSPYLVQFLLGPQNGGLELEPGRYKVWNMIVDNPTVPVFPSGWLTVLP
jgi:hypothetical protein